MPAHSRQPRSAFAAVGGVRLADRMHFAAGAETAARHGPFVLVEIVDGAIEGDTKPLATMNVKKPGRR
jgi:hypothetical protein